MTKISILGTGYVGLVAGVCLAELGHEVICVDVNQEKIDDLSKGKIPIYEPGLTELLLKNQANIRFTTDLSQAVRDSQAIFIAVGTPQSSDGRADLSFVELACKNLAKYIHDGQFRIIINKSTVPIGTKIKVANWIQQANPKCEIGKDFQVVSNPEFLREGKAVEDFMRPDRIIIGMDNPEEPSKAKKIIEDIYRPLTIQGFALLITDSQTAELIKYAGNGFLALKIGFINEMANICEKIGGDIDMVAKGIGLDSRIGKDFLKAGPGYGGSCFPKDTNSLYAQSLDCHAPATIIQAVIAANDKRQNQLAQWILQKLNIKSFGNKRICLLGLAFKGETDDIRESPALNLALQLHDLGANFIAFDPAAMANVQKITPQIQCASSMDNAVINADYIIIATEWRQFATITPQYLLNHAKNPIIIDLRNILNRQNFIQSGLEIHGIGR